MVLQEGWSLVRGSNALECETCQEYVVLQDRWSFMAVVSQDRFHCILQTDVHVITLRKSCPCHFRPSILRLPSIL